MAATDNTEAYTSVLDLNATEVYTQQQYVPSSSLPYSASGQHLSYITASIGGSDVNIAQYYYKVTMSRSDVTIDGGKSEAWLAISGSGYDPIAVNNGGGNNTQIISGNQLTNWISNKYATASNAELKAEGNPPGYNVQVTIDGNPTSAVFQFDYKTGILQFVNNDNSPSKTSKVAVTGYRYVGQTLDSFISSSGDGTGVGFPFSGSAVITGSLVISGSDTNDDPELIISGGLEVTEGIIASTGSIDNFTALDITAQSASIDHLTVNVLISGSTIVTSGSNTFGDGMEDTQTLIGTTRITGSAEITGSLNVSGSLQIQGIADVSASIAGAIAGGGIFDQVGATDVYKTDKQLLISSSAPLMSSPVPTGNPTVTNDGTDGTDAKYSVVTTQSMWHYNANVGVPKSKAWQTDLDGSYFNNFNHNTDTSEILRFIAGLLKDQAPDVQPNTATFASIIQDSQYNAAVSSPPVGYVPQLLTNTTYTYLNGKGFASPGQRLFNGSSVYSNPLGYGKDYKSQRGGSTTITSSNTNGTQLFGLGNIGGGFSVTSSQNWYYSDNSGKTQTATNSAELIKATGSGLTAVSEFTYSPIPTGVDGINPTFQDGLFENIFKTLIIDPTTAGAANFPTNFNTKEATGYYQITSSMQVQIGTGLQTSADEFEVLYAPMSVINSAFTIQNTNFQNDFSASISATSRSLGRAPYLKTANWQARDSVTTLFDPLYAGNSTNVVLMSSTGITTISDGGTGKKSLNFSAGNIATGFDNVVFNSGGSVARAAGSVPEITDIATVTSSISIAPTINQTNIVKAASIPNASKIFNVQISTLKGDNLASTSTLLPFSYFNDGTFGQNVSNGTMAYFGGSESDAGGSNANSTEIFKSDLYRKEVNDNLLPGTTPTAYNVGNAFDVNALAGLDLQVKPGFLVKPGGNYGYWLGANAGDGGDCRFYARTFSYNGSSTIKSITITFNSGTDLDDSNASPWINPTNNEISVLIFNRVQSGTPKFIDIADYTNIGNPGNQTANTSTTNPFGSIIDVLSNNNTDNSSSPSAAYKVSTSTAKFNDLTPSNPDWGMLIRYKGDPEPLTSIGVTYSTS